MKLHLPDSARLTVSHLADRSRVRFRYEEDFADPEMVARTAELAQVMCAAMEPGIAVSTCNNGLTIAIQGEVSRVTFGNMMTTEFMMWGSLAEMSLRDLMMGPLVTAFAAPANDNDAPASTRKRGKR